MVAGQHEPAVRRRPGRSARPPRARGPAKPRRSPPGRTAAVRRISSGSSRRWPRGSPADVGQPRSQLVLVDHLDRAASRRPASPWPCRWRPDGRAGSASRSETILRKQVLDGRVRERGDQHAERLSGPGVGGRPAPGSRRPGSASCRCPAVPTRARPAAGTARRNAAAWLSVKRNAAAASSASRCNASAAAASGSRAAAGSRSRRRNRVVHVRCRPCGGTRPRRPS